MASRRLVQYVVLAICLTLLSTAHLEWLETPAYDPTLLKPQDPPSFSRLRFSWELQAYGFNVKDKSSFCVMTFTAEDGAPATRTVYFYNSAARAREEEGKLVSDSVVVGRHTLLDSFGSQQERKVLVPRVTRRWHAQPAVVWTQGDDLWVLESASLFHLLAFEEWGFGPKQPSVSSPAHNRP